MGMNGPSWGRRHAEAAADKITKAGDWYRPLARPVRDRTGYEMKTRYAARYYILRLPAEEQKQRAWQQAAKLLLDGAPAEDVTKQLELAMFMSGRLDVVNGHQRGAQPVKRHFDFPVKK